MKFRLECQVSDLSVSEGNELHVNCGGENAIAIDLRVEVFYNDVTEEDEQRISAIAQGEWIAPPSVRLLYECLLVDRLPDGYEAPAYWVSDDYWFGTQSPGAVPNLGSLPLDVQDFIRSADGSLRRALGRVVDLLRWRFGVRGPHHALNDLRLRWSADGSEWRRAPYESDWTLWFPHEAEFTSTATAELQGFLQDDRSEPLGHGLLREAWEQREWNPRSALVIGIAAAEVGFKHFVAETVPMAAWLIEELQSPRLEDLLRKYLPIILAERSEFPIKSLPGKEIINPIAKAAEARYTIAHKSPTAARRHEEAEKWLETTRLESVLLAIADLLWLLDYYRGFRWALDYVRPETCSAWEALASG